MSAPEQLEGEVGVGDYRAALLAYGAADPARLLDVAGLPFGNSEQFGDASYAIDEALLVLLGLAASEGLLDRLVDYLGELCHGEVDDAGVWVHVVLCFVCLAPGAVSNRLALASQCVCGHSRSVAPAASRGGRASGPPMF